MSRQRRPRPSEEQGRACNAFVALIDLDIRILAENRRAAIALGSDEIAGEEVIAPLLERLRNARKLLVAKYARLVGEWRDEPDSNARPEDA